MLSNVKTSQSRSSSNNSTNSRSSSNTSSGVFPRNRVSITNNLAYNKVREPTKKTAGSMNMYQTAKSLLQKPIINNNLNTNSEIDLDLNSNSGLDTTKNQVSEKQIILTAMYLSPATW